MRLRLRAHGRDNSASAVQLKDGAKTARTGARQRRLLIATATAGFEDAACGHGGVWSTRNGIGMPTLTRAYGARGMLYVPARDFSTAEKGPFHPTVVTIGLFIAEYPNFPTIYYIY